MSGRIVLLAGLLLLALPAAPAAAKEPNTPADWLALAEDYAARITVPDGRAASLVSIGTGYVEAGLLDRAKPLLAEAAAYGWKCQGCFAKAQRLSDLALLQFRAGDPMAGEQTFRMARKACDELEEDADRLGALAYLGARRKESGDEMLARPIFAEALAGAKALRGEERWPVLADLALTFIVAGEDVMGEAALALLVGRAIGRDARLARFSLALERIDDYEEAARYVDRFRRDPDAALQVLCDLALAYHQDGDQGLARNTLSDAARLARARYSGRGRVDALLQVVRVAHALGARNTTQTLLHEAVKTASDRDDALARIAGLLDCARAAHVVGRGATLRQTLLEIPRLANGIEDAAVRDTAFGLVVRTAADIRDFVAAERAAGRIADPVARAEAQVDLAEGYRDDGNCARVLAIASRLLPALAAWSAEDRAPGLARRLAVLQAACGRPDEAAATVAAIGEDSPFHAATACTYIARDL